MLNNSHLYHQAQHDFKSRGIDVGSISLNLDTMLKAKSSAVTGLTKGIEGLFKKNKVDYLKGAVASAPHHRQGRPQRRRRDRGGGQEHPHRHRSEVTPFPASRSTRSRS